MHRNRIKTNRMAEGDRHLTLTKSIRFLTLLMKAKTSATQKNNKGRHPVSTRHLPLPSESTRKMRQLIFCRPLRC